MPDADVTKRKILFLVKPKTVSRADLKRAEKSTDFLIIECAEPESARLLEPPPDAGLDKQACAALALMRVVATGQTLDYKRGDLTRMFVEILLKGSPPTTVPSVKK
jgi:hypothetical protein